MRLVDRLLGRGGSAERMTLGELAETLSYQSQTYALSGAQTTMGREPVVVADELAAFRGSGVVYGVVQRRIDLFCQAKFAWKRLGSPARPMASDLFGTAELAPLDNPMGLLSGMELDVALYGNSFVTRDGAGLRRVPARWVTIAVDSPSQPGNWQASDARAVGYVFTPDGNVDRAEVFLPGEIAHYAPDQDPRATARGMSWMEPVLRDAANHRASKRWISNWWENAATPNSAVTFPADTSRETVLAYRDLFMERHAGADKAFRTAFIGGGAKFEPIGAGLTDLDVSQLTAAVVTELCAASGVPSVVLGATLGLEATTTYNNYSAAVRAYADFTVRPLWAKAVAALAPLFRAPSGAELWYDASGIAALQADAKDDAEVLARQASTIRTLIDGGYTPESVTLAVTTGNLAVLVHTGNLSVQLLPGGHQQPQGVAA